MVVCWLVVGWLLDGCWLVVGWLVVGWLLVDCWLVVGWLLIGCWLFVGWRWLVVSRLLVGGTAVPNTQIIRYRIIDSNIFLYFFVCRHISDNHPLILQNYEHGESLNFNQTQHEAFLMATLDNLRLQDGSSLDRLYNDLLSGDVGITPTDFSYLFDMLNVHDKQFNQILKILSKNCSLIRYNYDSDTSWEFWEFFQSEKFFQQVVKTDKIVAELWRLRNEHPVQLQEWKMKQRKINWFRSKLLQFLVGIFGSKWVQDLKMKAKLQRA